METTALTPVCARWGKTPPKPVHVVVGRRDQAVALASVWTNETAYLTDRMWPGPLTVVVPARAGGGDGDGVVHSHHAGLAPIAPSVSRR